MNRSRLPSKVKPHLNLSLVAGRVSVDCQVLECIIEGGAIAELNGLSTGESELLVQSTVGRGVVERRVEGICNVADVEGDLGAGDVGGGRSENHLRRSGQYILWHGNALRSLRSGQVVEEASSLGKGRVAQ